MSQLVSHQLVSQETDKPSNQIMIAIKGNYLAKKTSVMNWFLNRKVHMTAAVWYALTQYSSIHVEQPGHTKLPFDKQMNKWIGLFVLNIVWKPTDGKT